MGFRACVLAILLPCLYPQETRQFPKYGHLKSTSEVMRSNCSQILCLALGSVNLFRRSNAKSVPLLTFNIIISTFHRKVIYELLLTAMRM